MTSDKTNKFNEDFSEAISQIELAMNDLLKSKEARQQFFESQKKARQLSAKLLDNIEKACKRIAVEIDGLTPEQYDNWRAIYDPIDVDWVNRVNEEPTSSEGEV